MHCDYPSLIFLEALNDKHPIDDDVIFIGFNKIDDHSELIPPMEEGEIKPSEKVKSILAENNGEITLETKEAFTAPLEVDQ